MVFKVTTKHVYFHYDNEGVIKEGDFARGKLGCDLRRGDKCIIKIGSLGLFTALASCNCDFVMLEGIRNVPVSMFEE